jgi:hypothetical protein
MSDFPNLLIFGTHIQIPKLGDKWYRLIYFDEDDQHLEFFDEEENVVLSSNDLITEDIIPMYVSPINEFYEK